MREQSDRTRAFVKPRVLDQHGELRLLTDLIEQHIGDGVSLVRIKGNGKSFAIRYLEEFFGDLPSVRFIDDQPVKNVDDWNTTVTTKWTPNHKSVEYQLARWSMDDCIDYLLTAAPDSCKSVMNRIVKADDFWLTSGTPSVVVNVLDELIANPKLPSVEAAIASHFESQNIGRFRKWRILSICLKHMLNDNRVVLALNRINKSGFADPGLIKFLSTQTVRYVLVAAALIRRIAARRCSGVIAETWTPTLIEFLAKKLINTNNTKAMECLNIYANGKNDVRAGNAASLLYEVDPRWRPVRSEYMCLENANLRGASWPGWVANKSLLLHCDLSNANLSGCELKKTCVSATDFSKTNFRDANLEKLVANRANFDQAILLKANGKLGDFKKASFRKTNLELGIFKLANFSEADLFEANLDQTDFSEATLINTNLEGASAVGACFRKANLTAADLRTTEISSANFSRCNLTRANLAGKTISEMFFNRAYMRCSNWSNTRAIACSFHQCDFSGSFMGEVEWTNCDLRCANFTECQFFYGSTRSGLVDSPYPSHGTRTGFYTDEYENQHFQPIEEIRKASFQGCDFRGAYILNADFYLVDLRGAKYDKRQKEHFQRCGALLRD